MHQCSAVLSSHAKMFSYPRLSHVPWTRSNRPSSGKLLHELLVEGGKLGHERVHHLRTCSLGGGSHITIRLCFRRYYQSGSGLTSSRGRMVVRRWNVPSSCPKPEPGTVLIPVASSSLRQYSTSGALPSFLAASMALGGRRTWGDEHVVMT